MSTVPNSGLVPLEQRAAILRSLKNASAYAPEDIAADLYENVQQLLGERDRYGQDAYHDGKRADAAESDLIVWSYRIDALRDIHKPFDTPDDPYASQRCAGCIAGYDPKTRALVHAKWPCASDQAINLKVVPK